MKDLSFTEQQQRDVDEYLELSSAEERLSWLMERSPIHSEIPSERCGAERRIPGCLSGLWLEVELRSGALLFSARSESSMVQGIVSFICDLHSGRSAEEILQIGSSIVDDLGLERLLSLTRKRAVASTLQFMVASARSTLPQAVGT